ncbi:MAG: MotA/TolQ/ExbB proton channel family protein, partial [Chromatiales bacterium]|nr:MotA/TolQ/ExbB proton channel family protein [Chromatiales bacterium]
MNNPYGVAALWSEGGPVIKAVAITLLLMSIVSWYVIITRTWRAAKLRRASAAMASFWHTYSFAEGMALLNQYGETNPFRHVAIEAQMAVDHHVSSKDDLHGQISMAEWLTESLRGAIDDSAERMQAGLAILASVGSTAPFVGLFGTVWGIYHALMSIGIAGQASIEKVAGPVGEALIMTAFGLGVAI